MKHRMRRIVSVLVAVVALAGVVADTAPASGQADKESAPISGVKIPAGYRDWSFSCDQAVNARDFVLTHYAR